MWAATVLALDTPINGTLNPGIESELFQFAATAGQRLFFDSLATAASSSWNLYGPGNQSITGSSLSSDREFTLESTGTYTLVLAGSNTSGTVDYSFQLVDATPRIAELTLDTVVSGNISQPGDQDIFTFEGTAGQRLYFDGLENNSNIRAELRSPSGGSLFNLFNGSDGVPLTLVESGQYELVLDASGDITDSYSFRLADVGTAPVLEFGTTVSGTLDPGIESELFQFTGTAGQTLFFNSLSASASSAWTLYGPSNQAVTGTSLSSDREFTLGSDGLYTLVLDGSNTSGTVDYSFQLFDTTPTITELSLDTVVTGNIAQPGAKDVFTFEGTAGQRLYFDGLDNGSNVLAELLSPTGSRLFNVFNGSNNAPVTLIETGSYQLVLDITGDTTDSYSFRLADIGAAPVLELGTTVSGTLDPGIESELFQFTATAGQSFFFNSLAASASSSWNLYGPGNQYITGSSLSSDRAFTLESAGTYLLALEGTNTSGTVDYSFQLFDSTPTVAELTLDAVVTGNIAQPGAQNIFTFDGSAGQRLLFDGLDSDSNARAELFSPSGSSLINRFTGSDNAPVTLIESGSYQLVLSASGDITDAYSFRLADASAAPVLELSTPIIGTLDPGIESELFQFAAVAGQTFFFDSLATTASSSWNLYGPGNQYITGSSLSSDREFTVEREGSYTLVLTGANASGTVDYSFQLIDATPTVDELTLGTVITGDIAQPGEKNIFTFEGALGQRLYFDGLDIASTVTASLLSPSGQSLFAIGTSSDRAPVTLTEVGTYQLLLDASSSNIGSYSFNLTDITSVASLPLGTTLNGTLDPGIETELYQFTGTSGQRLSFNSLTAVSGASWQVYGAGNQSLINRSLGSDFDVVLPSDGLYVLAIDGASSNSTINYSFQVTDTSEAPVAVSGFGTVQSGTIAAGQQDTYTFTAPAGLRVYFDSLDVDGDPLRVDFTDPDGTFVFSQSASSDRTNLLLTRSGTYTLTVRGSNTTSTGDYSFQFLSDAPDGLNELTLGEAISETLTAQTTTGYRFAGTAGQQLYFDGLNNSSVAIRAEIYSPSGERLFTIDTSADVAPLTLVEAGTYVLWIDGDHTADTDYSFRLSDTSSATALTFGTAVSGTLDPGVESQLFQFSGTAGQAIFFDSLTSGSNNRWDIYGPGNQYITGSSISSDREFILASAGTYTLVLDGSTAGGTVDYSFQLVDATPIVSELTLDTVVTGAIALPGQKNTFTFSGTAGQRVYFDSLANSSNNVVAELLSPSGNRLFSIFSGGDSAPTTLNETGTYQLVLDISGDTTDTYSFRLAEASAAPILELGTPVSGTLDPGIESKLFQFTSTAGQKFFFDGLSTSGSSRWDIYGPGDQYITGGSSLSTDREFTLTSAGTYTLILDGANTSGTVDYSFQLLDATPTTAELTLNTVVEGAIAQPGEQDIFTFEGTAGQRIYFDGLASSSNVLAALFSPTGSRAFNLFSGSDSDPLTLTETGTYQLVLDTSSDTTDTYRFRVGDLSTAPVLELGTTISGTLEPGIESDLFQFTGSAGQTLYFDSLLDTSRASVNIYGPGNQFITSASTGFDREFTLTSAGSYSLIVAGSNVNNAIDYSFQLVDATPTTAELTLDEVVTGAISKPGEQDIFTFTGSAGQRLYFDGLTNGSNVRAELRSPSGSSLFNLFNGSDSSTPITLAESGTYQLVLDIGGDTTEPYSFRLADASAAPVIALGTSITGTLDPGIESELFQFTATAGQTFYFDNATISTRGRWDIFGPSNQRIASSSINGDGEFTITSGGAYTLVLEGFDTNEVIDYSFQLLEVTPTAATLNLSEVVAGSIAQPGEQDLFTFTGTAGQRLFFDGLENSSNVFAELQSPSGNSLFTVFNGNDSNLLTLTETGTYTLVLDGSGSTTDDYSFQLFDLDDATDLAFNTTLTGSLNPGIETEFYRFTAAAGETFFLDDLGSNGFGGTWRLYSLGDQQVTAGTLGFDFETTLNIDGEYILLLDGSSGTPINYNFQAYLPAITTQELNLTAAAGGQKSFTYEATFNQLTSTTDELGHQTLYDIDSITGNVLSIVDVIGQIGGDDDIQTQFTYTNKGLVDLVIDSLGRTTDYDYNTLGQLTSTTFAKGTADETTQRFEYDSAGNTSAIIDGKGNRTEYEYDVLNRLVKIVEADPDGSGELTAPITEITYDLSGNQLSTNDAQDNLTQNEYDELNRLTKITDSLNQVTEYGYDQKGNLVSIIDSLERETQNIYDQRDRLIETIDPDNGRTISIYDFDNNLVSVVDSVGNETKFTYDARSRLVSETDPLEKTFEFEYDSVDNLTAQNDRNGRRTEFNYDDLDRLVNENWVGTDQVITYSFDKASNLTSVLDKFSSLSYTHDNLDRVLSIDSSISGTPNVVLSYTYDANGNVLSVSDSIDGEASGSNVYSYDNLNRVIQVTQSGLDVNDKRVDFNYNDIGQITRLDRYSDIAASDLVVSTAYDYDTLSRLQSITHSNDVETVAFHNFSYNETDRIKQITNIDGVTDYTYDNRDQLVEAEHSDPTNTNEFYTYDANGNRISSSLHGSEYVTGPGNRLLSDGAYTYDYDDEGNLIQRTEIATGEVREFQWDYRNRLIAITDRDSANLESQKVEYTYDVFDRRITKSVDTSPQDAAAVLTHFVYDGSDVHLEFIDDDGTDGADPLSLDIRYLHGPEVDQVLAQERSSSEIAWHLADKFGTIHDLVDNDGNVVNHLTYDSFGNVVSETNPDLGNRYGFTGRELDRETGLYFYRARYYDSTTGSFLSSDPIGFSGGDANLYRYVRNDPANHQDPTGLVIDTIADVGFILYDLYRIGKDNVFGNCDNLAENLGALGADILGAAIPFASGGGLAVRAGTKADDILKAGKKITEGIYDFHAKSSKRYVGQSKDIDKRLNQHIKSGKLDKNELPNVNKTEVLGGKTKREISEQRKIDSLGGIKKPDGTKNLENKVNPIGPKRRHLLDD